MEKEYNCKKHHTHTPKDKHSMISMFFFSSLENSYSIIVFHFRSSNITIGMFYYLDR